MVMGLPAGVWQAPLSAVLDRRTAIGRGLGTPVRTRPACKSLECWSGVGTLGRVRALRFMRAVHGHGHGAEKNFGSLTRGVTTFALVVTR